MRPKGTQAELAARRMVAARFFAEGKGPTEVAKRLGVAQGLGRKQTYERYGKEGLRAKRCFGKKPRLTPEDRRIARDGLVAIVLLPSRQHIL